MSRTVNSDCASSDSFESLLDRLTRRASASDSSMHAASGFDSTFESINASSPLLRRVMPPVTEARSAESKSSSSDSMPLSYEKALRLHARRNLVADTDLRNTHQQNSDVAQSNRGLQKTSRARAVSTPPTQQSRRAGSSSGMSSNPIPLATPVHPSSGNGKHTLNRNGNRPAKPEFKGDKRAGTPGTQTTPRVSLHNPTPATPKASLSTFPAAAQAKPSAPSRADRRQAITAQDAIKSSKVRRSGSQDKSVGRSASGRADGRSGSISQMNRPVRTIAGDANPNGPNNFAAKTIASRRQPVRHNTPQRDELALELQLVKLQLEHRHSVVSIRLNDTEIERLRERAAESGISVSAYMRSCVLDAERLRAQVKEALAEMRASMQPSNPALSRPQPLQGEAAPLSASQPSHLPVLSGIGFRGESAWSRLLLKSATFLLGPWFFFRHRP